MNKTLIRKSQTQSFGYSEDEDLEFMHQWLLQKDVFGNRSSTAVAGRRRSLIHCSFARPTRKAARLRNCCRVLADRTHGTLSGASSISSLTHCKTIAVEDTHKNTQKVVLQCFRFHCFTHQSTVLVHAGDENAISLPLPNHSTKAHHKLSLFWNLCSRLCVPSHKLCRKMNSPLFPCNIRLHTEYTIRTESIPDHKLKNKHFCKSKGRKGTWHQRPTKETKTVMLFTTQGL